MLEETLLKYFGYRTFRRSQKEIIKKVLKNQNVLGILPTGAGKSLLYQLPSLLLPGITIVISPLISLMEDQVFQLRKIGLPIATFINSSTTTKEYYSKLHHLKKGKYKILYISPEKLQQTLFLKQLEKIPISLFVIDEAHCISQWGHDFRPDYLKIKDIISRMKGTAILALTATATPAVQEDILQQLALSNMEICISSHDRENIAYQVTKVDSEEEKKRILEKTVTEIKGPGIIYVNTRRNSEQLTQSIKNLGFDGVEAYHAGLSYDERSIIQHQFMNEELRLIVATKAFGMGINKKNVRYVIHYNMPANIESYMQEIGRVGRDGLPGYALLLYQQNDEIPMEHLIKYEYPSGIQLREIVQQVILKKGKEVKLEDMRVTQLNEQMLELVFFYMEQLKFIKIEKQRGEYLIIEVAKIPDYKIINELEQIFEERILKRKQELSEMLKFINCNKCRRQAILKYFNESLIDKPKQCCDYCGIDLNIYKYGVENTPVTIESFDWRQELSKLLPLGGSNDQTEKN